MIGMSEAWLLPVLPGAAFVVLVLFGNYLPRKGDWLAILAIFGSFVLFFPVAADLTDALARTGEKFVGVSNSIAWFQVGDVFQARLGVFVDQIAVVMLAVVTFVSLMVQVYSLGYMKGDARYGWYYAVMSLFAAAMLTLVLADNFLLLYFVWEIVGICSYLLIGHYHERRSAAEAAKKAFITTRIGDLGFLIGIILLWRSVGTFNISETFRAASAGEIPTDYLTVSVLLLFLGAMGKSAQFPLHVWLPDAMEGPTPVSALIHAATMVVAGVYMVARTLPLFQAAGGVTLPLVTGIGLITVLMSATMGLVMSDIKRVIAYSTLNSLGLMIVALGAGLTTAAMFYLFVHAFFKALLFLAAGSVYHATDELEVEQMGGLGRKMPLTAITFSLGALSMAGIVPLAGFWAKDDILRASFDNQNIAVFLLLALSVVLTALYMTRMVLLVFTGEPRNRRAHEHAHDAPLAMSLPLVALAVLTVVGGFVAFDAVGKALGFPGGIGEFVFVGGEPETFMVNGGVMALSIVLAVAGVIGGLYIWRGQALPARRIAEAFPWAYRTLRNKYYMDDIYQALINGVVLGFSAVVAWFDRIVVNDKGVNGTAAVPRITGYVLKFHETGKLPNYALGIAVGVIVLAVVAFSLAA
jgi:NADH-quinone oxidoreductase subunit L